MATRSGIISNNTFPGLADTPDSLDGQAGKVVTVLPSEDGLFFADPAGGMAPVDSVFGRIGDVTAQEGDYIIDQLGDVDTTSQAPVLRDRLIWDGANWVPYTPQNDTASATANTTTTSSSDVLVNSMTLTPGAGTYLVYFSSSWRVSGEDRTIFCSIYANGVKIDHTERCFGNGEELSNECVPVATHAIVTVADAQAIEIRWRRTGGTATMMQRTLTLARID